MSLFRLQDSLQSLALYSAGLITLGYVLGRFANQQKKGGLRHLVIFKLKPNTPEDAKERLINAFTKLAHDVGPSVVSNFEYGINNSPEEFADGMTHCKTRYQSDCVLHQVSLTASF
jgi:hypothetical protein